MFSQGQFIELLIIIALLMIARELIFWQHDKTHMYVRQCPNCKTAIISHNSLEDAAAKLRSHIGKEHSL